MRVAFQVILGLGALFFFADGRAGTIYRCEQGGVQTFSDRPCGANAQTYVPDVSRVSEYESVPATFAREQTQEVSEKHSRSTSSIAEMQAKHVFECKRLRDSLEGVHDKMRAGYNAKEGERLKERERKLNATRREKHC